MRRFIRKKEAPFLLAVLLLALATWAILSFWPRRTTAVWLRFADGAAYAVDLSQNGVLRFEDGALPVTLEVQNGRVRFVDSVCPDHLCEGFGWVGRPGESAICLPAGAFLSAEQEPT